MTLPKEKTSDLRRIAKKSGWWKLKEGGCHEIWTNGKLTESIKRSPQTGHGLFKKSKKKFEEYPGPVEGKFNK